MHTAEFYVSRDCGGPKIACNIHRIGESRPEPNEDRSGMQGAFMCLDDEEFLAMFGFIPGPLKSRKVRVTVEEIPEPPPKPRLCWLAWGGDVYSGFKTDLGTYMLANEKGERIVLFEDQLEEAGKTVHWYDEELENSE